MKTLYLLLATALIAAPTFSTAAIASEPLTANYDARVLTSPIGGRVLSDKGVAVEYATVVFTDNEGRYVAGTVTDAEGRFDIELKRGDYIMELTCMGYKPYKKSLTLSDELSLGDISIESDAMEVEEVVVKGNAIINRADGYSVALGDSKYAEGRNAREALRYVPGLWVDKDDNITINGRGGVVVMLNDRIVHMSSTELLNYLETIKAEDIKSIDIVRSAGAKYDASAGGSILKITLRNPKNNGLYGSVSMKYERIERIDTMSANYAPSVSFNYMKNKLSLSTAFAYGRINQGEYDDISIYYKDRPDTTDSRFKNNGVYNNLNYYIRGVYQIDDRNSVGLDYDLGVYSQQSDSYSESWFRGESYGDNTVYSNAFQANPRRWMHTHNISANYRNKLDTLGSEILVVADYNISRMQSRQSYTTNMSRVNNLETFSYIYDNSLRNSDLYTVRLDATHYFNKRWNIGYGAKYSYSMMTSDYGYYTSDNDVDWIFNNDYSDNYDYNEGVAAAYVSTNGSFGRFSLVAGLRIENTDVTPKSNKENLSVHRNYTDLFPSASFSYSIKSDGSYLVSASYRRSIVRPGFSLLNPRRTPVSSIATSVGNPYLNPYYRNDVSLNFVLDGKYTFEFGYQKATDKFAQIVTIDPVNPEQFLYIFDNYDNEEHFTVNTYLPFSPFKWWDINLSGGIDYQKTTVLGKKYSALGYYSQLLMLFSLPKDWSVELSGSGAGNFLEGNMRVVNPIIQANGSIRKSFKDGKYVVSLNVSGLGVNKMNIEIDEREFTQKLTNRQTYNTPRFGVTFRYNFKAGKEFRAANVVKGNSEEASRVR